MCGVLVAWHVGMPSSSGGAVVTDTLALAGVHLFPCRHKDGGEPDSPRSSQGGGGSSGSTGGGGSQSGRPSHCIELDETNVEPLESEDEEGGGGGDGDGRK